jgi:hypothetical protein
MRADDLFTAPLPSPVLVDGDGRTSYVTWPPNGRRLSYLTPTSAKVAEFSDSGVGLISTIGAAGAISPPCCFAWSYDSALISYGRNSDLHACQDATFEAPARAG